MFDRFGNRIDEVVFPPEYRELVTKGYEAGVVFRAVEEGNLLASYQVGYVTSFYDAGLYCPHTVSLSTAIPLAKYGSPLLRATYLPKLLRRDSSVWQGATWMTEAKGGSDLGSFVETVARPDGDRWLLTGEKYFTSNVGAELAMAARPEGAPAGVRGLELFLVPSAARGRNAQLQGPQAQGQDRDPVGPDGRGRAGRERRVPPRRARPGDLPRPRVAQRLPRLQQHRERRADPEGSPRGVELRRGARRIRQARGRAAPLRPAGAGTSRDAPRGVRSRLEEVTLLSEVWRETPRYSDRYHLFRLVAHLAKFWTAEVAVQTAKWAMEAHGGAGILADYPVERLLREAMILGIWEGTPHRQILDGMEVVEKKRVHVPLLDGIAARGGNAVALAMARAEVDDWLTIPAERKEAESERVFSRLAGTVARELRRATT